MIRMMIKNKAPDLKVEFVDKDGPDVDTLWLNALPEDNLPKLDFIISAQDLKTDYCDCDPRLEKKLKRQQNREFMSKRERRNRR